MAKKGHEIPTIDVNLVTVKGPDADIEIALNTASQIQVEPQTSSEERVELVVKGRLIAQKPPTTTITGNTITLTDNVLNPELVQILQGGTVLYWTNASHSGTADTDAGFGVAGYRPPKAGSADKGQPFTLCAYSAIYDAAGLIEGYEKITYPNCQGNPVAFGSQDGVFRAPAYTINSAPKEGEEPYQIDYVDELPTVTEPEAPED